MRIGPLSASLAWMACAAAALPLPALASAAPAAEAAPPPPKEVPQAPERTLDVPADELADLPPAEPPPSDFTAAQFIDSAGCVFVRTPGGWRARVARDGSAICGYPPTFSARRSGPDEVQPLFAEPQEPRARQIERVLTETILPALQDGELAEPGAAASGAGAGTALAAPAPQAAAVANGAGAPASAAQAAAGRAADAGPAKGQGGDHPDHPKLAETAPAPAGKTAAKPAPPDPLGLSAAVRHAPVLAAAPSARADRLCRLLGADAAAQPGLGNSSALGLCGGQVAALPAADTHAPRPAPEPPDPAVRVAGAGHTGDAVGTASPPATGDPASRPDTAQRSASAATQGSAVRRVRADAAPRRGVAAKAGAAGAAPRKTAGKTESKGGPAKERAAPGATIPPGARFVQIGAYTDPANAARTAERLKGMGLPVVQSRAGTARSIMVGPLPGRESIARTIDRVRRAGYRDAFARR